MLSFIVFIFITAAVLYSRFMNISLEMVYKDSTSNLKSVSLSASNMNTSLTSLALRCYFDDTISQMMYYSPNIDNYSKYSNTLYSYKNIFPYIDSIYVYNGDDFYICPGYSIISSKKNFADEDIKNILNHLNSYPSGSIIPRNLNNSLFSDQSGHSFVYTYIFYDGQVTDGTVDQAIVLNVSANWLKQSIDSFNNDGSRILIINGKGQTVINDSKDHSLTNLSNQKYISDILHSKKRSGSFLGYADGQLSLISYISTNVMDWRYISITPYSKVVNKINVIRNDTLLIGFSALLLGIFVTFFLSRRLFVPFSSLVTDFNTISTEKRRNFFRNKQELLTGFVMAGKEITPEQQKEYGFRLNFSQNISVFLMAIDRFSLFCSDYNLNDRNVMKFGIMNITEELILQKYICECANINESSILVLMNRSKTDSSDQKVFIQLLNEIKTNVKEHLGLSLTMIIGCNAVPAYALRQEYLHVLEATEYRMFSGIGSIIMADDVHFKSADQYHYSEEKEKTLNDAIMLGQSTSAKALIEEIFTCAGSFGSLVFNTTVLRILLSLEHSVNVIQNNNSITTDFDFDSYLNTIRNMETIPDILEKFYHLFDQIASELEKNKLDKHDRLLENVIEIVNLQYPSPELCLDNIADMVKISPNYLAKLFKKYKLISLNEYINNVRISKARVLILEENLPNNVVMERTGFSSRSHFYTEFKKAYGVSPRELRKAQ